MKPLKASVPLFLVLSVLTLTFTFLAVPVSSRVATGSYYLDTPLPIASYYVGQYSNSTYFAINGSNWQNFIRSPNASYIVNSVIDAAVSSERGGRVTFATAEYVFDSGIIITPMTSGKSLELIGENSETYFTYSGSTLNRFFVYNSTNWYEGLGQPKLTIKNIKFSFNTHASDNYCLYLNHIATDLENVIVFNSNTSNIQGQGIYIVEDNDATGGSSIPMKWENVVVNYFENGIRINIDHITIINPSISYATTEAFRIHWCGWVNVYNPTCYFTASSPAYCYVFSGDARHIAITNPTVEGPSTGAGATFMDYGTAYTNDKAVTGFGYENSNFTTFGNVFTEQRIQIVGISNYGEAEASNDDYIAHGLGGIPNYVYLTVFESNSAYTVQVKATNSTHFQIYLYDVVAAGVEVVDQTIVWGAVYQP